MTSTTWKDGLKLLGVLPTRYVVRPLLRRSPRVPFFSVEYEFVEIDRCDVDKGLVTNSQESLSRHAGHRMRQPTTVSFFELFLIWTRIIS